MSGFSFLNSAKKGDGLDFLIETLVKQGVVMIKKRGGVMLIFILKTLSNGISFPSASQEELNLIQSNLQICYFCKVVIFEKQRLCGHAMGVI